MGDVVKLTVLPQIEQYEPDPGALAMMTEIDSLIDPATRLLRDRAHLDRAGELLRMVRLERRRRVEYFAQIKRPLNALREEVLRLERAALEPVDRYDALIEDAWSAEREAIERERREDERRRAEDALREAEAQRAARAEAARAAAETMDPVAALGIVAQADAIEAAPILPVAVAPAPAAPTTPGVSLVTRWSAEVVDFAALVRAVAAGDVPLDALQPNSTWLSERAREQREAFAMPGVVARASTHAAVRK